jgi:hypothetical protein
MSFGELYCPWSAAMEERTRDAKKIAVCTFEELLWPRYRLGVDPFPRMGPYLGLLLSLRN